MPPVSVWSSLISVSSAAIRLPRGVPAFDSRQRFTSASPVAEPA